MQVLFVFKKLLLKYDKSNENPTRWNELIKKRLHHNKIGYTLSEIFHYFLSYDSFYIPSLNESN